MIRLSRGPLQRKPAFLLTELGDSEQHRQGSFCDPLFSWKRVGYQASSFPLDKPEGVLKLSRYSCAQTYCKRFVNGMQVEKQKKFVLDIPGILERFAEAGGFHRDADIADALGMSRAAISNARKNGHLNLHTLVGACIEQGFDLAYILTGTQATSTPTVEQSIDALAKAGYRVTIERVKEG